ncbi:1,4-alpha-glucan branching protein GlgB [Curtanaerobium respiraculi]|uniref:1,4-alpha-glucan branching protein GlgB n=1 Tax=Curtanaerobium respiraculi TaxID=2949669 RepID=UPI0024B323A0|nr:1,4-alpha-glucan branching protein GlgB [Curtanaerobium respiraculi]
MENLSKYLRDTDLYLFGEGNAQRAYLTFGCHKIATAKKGDKKGDTYLFCVWAPHAAAVHVAGEFNGWDEAATPLEEPHPGIWAGTVRGLEDGSPYKYCITGKDGEVRWKADPYAFHAENGLSTASKVWNLDGYTWGDAAWMEQRAARDNLHAPMSIYELHLGSWRVGEGEVYPNYRTAGSELAKYCKKMGYTHVELMPLTEYPLPASWGYQCTGYFSPTSRYGTPQDLMAMIDELHGAGVGVILDWVPAHFPRDSWALAQFDGEPLYEYADPRKGEHMDWGTLVFDYEKPQVVSFLISSAMFFFDVYHIDGIRVDAVSSMLYLDYSRTDWVPNKDGGNINLEAVEFLRKLNSSILTTYPGAVTIAEESTAFPMVTYPPDNGGLGFTFKWDMGYMHDTLEYFQMDPLFRSGNHDKLTFGMMYAFSENFILAYSHDEVVHGKRSMVDKMFGDYEQKFATLKSLMGFQFAHPGKKLTFMGGEFGQFIEWNFEQQLDWMLLDYPAHRGMQKFSADLNKLYAKHPALWKNDDNWDGFMWSNVDDRDESSLAILRTANMGFDTPDVVACFNFTPNPLNGFIVGLPTAGSLKVILNSDDPKYGGVGEVEVKSVRTKGEGFVNYPFSAHVDIPPLSAVYYEFKRRKPAQKKPKAAALGLPSGKKEKR